jgi:hypothetical protein
LEPSTIEGVGKDIYVEEFVGYLEVFGVNQYVKCRVVKSRKKCAKLSNNILLVIGEELMLENFILM